MTAPVSARALFRARHTADDLRPDVRAARPAVGLAATVACRGRDHATLHQVRQRVFVHHHDALLQLIDQRFDAPC